MTQKFEIEFEVFEGTGKSTGVLMTAEELKKELEKDGYHIVGIKELIDPNKSIVPHE